MSAFSPRQMFLLDEACKPVAEAFDAAPYLVGTAAHRGPYRDVDVRLILTDERYDELAAAHTAQGMAFLGLAIGEYLASRTVPPVDFQLQRSTGANSHVGLPRSPLGLRDLTNYRGDALGPEKNPAT